MAALCSMRLQPAKATTPTNGPQIFEFGNTPQNKLMQNQPTDQWRSRSSVYDFEQYRIDMLKAQIDIAIADIRANAHLLTPEQHAELREITRSGDEP